MWISRRRLKYLERRIIDLEANLTLDGMEELLAKLELRRKEKEDDNLITVINRIMVKYAGLVENQIDSAQSNFAEADLRDVYDGIRILGNIAVTLERHSNLERHTDERKMFNRVPICSDCW
jgi:hypothetical protein